jgi:non-specific serine/threonine protein kinase
MLTPSLTIHLFGPLQVLVGAEPWPRVPTRSIEWLLALLVLRHGRAVERSWLAGTLWLESMERQALNNLRNDLVHLRKALGNERERLRSPTRDTLLLDLDGAEVDLIAFDQAMKAGDEGALKSAVALYTGPLLEGCYEAWVTQERESREQACLTALEMLAERAGERAEHAEAVRYLRQAQALDPLRDSTVRRLMASLAASGDPGAAVEVYRELRNRLHKELAAAPDEETTRLFQQIRQQARVGNRVVGVGSRSSPSPPERQPSNDTPPTEISLPQPFSLNTRHTALPPYPLAPLIGREQEVHEIQERLTQSRLVTLIGAGGVGKTRLAMEVAARCEETFPGGVVWVELAPLAEGALILPTIATALGLPQGGVSDLQTLLSRLVSHFSEGAFLLALDNCEHLLDALSALVQTLLSRCPLLRVLATSRQRMGLAGELAWRVPSLASPDPQHLPADPKQASAAALTFPAVRLFVERAASARMELQLTRREQVEALCRICRRLDGIPLALELAAARTNVLSVEQIASRLDDRFRLLTGGSHADPPRHRTLRALIDWSHDQLSEPERVLLRRLSVFAGGWSLEAAGAVFGLESGLPMVDRGEVLEVLASLVDKSLVFVEEQAEGLRYRMLETVREYGRERLAESGEEEAVRARHAAHYLALAEEARPFLDKPEPVWLDRLEAEHDNLRAALTCFAAQEQTMDGAVQLAVALAAFWHLRGHFYERRTWLVSLARRPTAPTRARAELLGEAAQAVAYDRDFAGTRQMFTEALGIMRRLGDRRGVSNILNGLALLLGEPRLAGLEYDPVAARAFAAESLAMMREAGDRQGMAHSLFRLGSIARQTGDHDEARAYWTECRRLDQALGVKGGLVLLHMGDLALESGDNSAARRCFETFLSERHEIGELLGVVWALRGLGELALAEGEPERGARLLGASLAVRESFAQPLTEEERALYEKTWCALREDLDGAACDAARAEGLAMSLEQAVEYALEAKQT